MSDVTGTDLTPGEAGRARVRLARERRDNLRLTGEIALLLAAACSAGTLLAGRAPGASASFLVECMALGVAALGAARVRSLRHAVPLLSLVAAGALLLFVAVETVHTGERMSMLAAVACALVFPLIALQVARRRRRALAVCSAGATIIVAATVAGMRGAVLAPFVVAIAFSVSVGLLVAREIELRRARRDRREAQRRRTITRERRLMEVREEMVANLSHDLRNPLAIALGFSEMAGDGDLSAEERTQALAGVRRSLWEILQLVENVIDGSADQAGALSPRSESVDLDELCQEALASTHVLLRSRPIALVGSIEPGVIVIADRQRLARIVGNLLGNACKYTERGEIRLVVRSSGDCAEISVIDTGSGIAPDAMPFIFDRYRRAHNGGRGGVGLGLAIAKRLAERMGGSLAARSELGEGSTFTLQLPLAQASSSEQTSAAA